MNNRDEARIYDVRTLERNLRKGLISRKDVDKYLKGLPDAADKSTACNPEAQSREAERPHPAPRPVVIATAAAASPDGDELDDDLDDDLDEDEDEDDEEEDEVEAVEEGEK